MSTRLSPRPTTSSSTATNSAPIEHAPTEPTGCIAKPEGNGRVTVYSNTQALYFTLDNMALILGVPFNKLRLVGGTVGGGFGGKVDVIVEPIAALGAMLTNRPVKYAYSGPRRCRCPRRAPPSASTSRTAS